MINVKILSFPVNHKEILWVAARNCYSRKSFEDIQGNYSEDKFIQLINTILQKKHESILEHINLTFLIDGISRSLVMQLTRHRHASFSSQSQHFQLYDDFMYKELEEYHGEHNKIKYHALMSEINTIYKSFINDGMPKYIAREILPNGAICKLVMTCNLRELRYIIGLRSSLDNTPEIRSLMEKIKEEFIKNLPIYYLNNI